MKFSKVLANETDSVYRSKCGRYELQRLFDDWFSFYVDSVGGLWPIDHATRKYVAVEQCVEHSARN